MNHCRKCQSDYEKPGTCNCYAPVVAAPQPAVAPWYQYQWTTCGQCGASHSGTHICSRPMTSGTVWIGYNNDTGISHS